MAGAIYAAGWWPAVPFVLLRYAATSRRRPGLARIRPGVPAFSSRPIWVHAVSVGEVISVLPLIEALQARRPEVPLLLTAGTTTGMSVARERATVPVAWFPLDHPLVVRDFFRRVRPRALVLMESELWPSVLNRARTLGVPVALVNGRLSESSARNHRRFAAFLRPAVRRIAAAGVQTELYAGRLAALGLDRGRIVVTGNIKFGAAPRAVAESDKQALRAALGLSANEPVLVFGSTRPGDEALAASCLPELLTVAPDLRVIVAPRHLHRLAEVKAAFSAWPTARRSAIGAGGGRDARVIVLDTLGELARVYSLASVAVVGGSFGGGIGGHNPIEPAAQGVPVVFGPDVRNFPEVCDVLVNAQAAVQVRDGDGLRRTLSALMADATRREQMGAHALETVTRNRVTLDRTVDLVLGVVDSAAA